MAETPQATSTTTSMNLRNEITVNGRKYPAGVGINVPKEQAEDMERIDMEHDKYKDSLMRKNTYNVDSGTISVGGGAV